MAPSEKQPFYDPIPPTYDEAVASGSRYDDWDDGDTESQSLIPQPNNPPTTSRRPDGYQPPTVETDESDIESLLDNDTDDEEAAQVRREVEEMEIEEPTSRSLLWGKRIGFSLSKWKWSWRPRLPTLPRMRIQLPQRADGDAGAEINQDADTPPTRRWNWPKLPEFNSMLAVIIFARILGAFILLGFVYLLFASDFFNSFGGRLNGGFRFNAEDLRVHILNQVDPRRMRASVKHFSSYAHIAGTQGDYATAMDMESMFARAGLDEIKLDEYQVYINYPRPDGRTVQIMDGDNATWTAILEEEDIGEGTFGHQTYAFHGHSKSGDVRGPLIYANYGSREDFKKLKKQGIDTNGAIALVRYYGTQSDRALKVKAAELAGFAGCIIYSDPADDGFKKGVVAPHGPYMPPDGVQRGSVSLMNWVVGDVLTPGWESKEGQPRMKVDATPGLNKIPSLPLSWRDAQVLLQHLKGHGQRVPDGWQGGVPEVEWWTGDHKSPIVRLQNEQDEEEKQPIWNVYGKILGMEQSAKSIIIGNHRDSWAFGAIDPHSGTAVMVEMARIFGELVARGWRPLRTIEFMSWDAEEYNLIGSTEYVENNLEALRQNAYAYINLDTAVTGHSFHAAGSPALTKTLMHSLGRILDPNINMTLRELWDERGGELEGLGAGSDYVAFQDIAGCSSIDLEFRGQEGDASYPMHSSYDNLNVLEKYIDPDFVYHGLMAQVVGLLILDLSDKSVLPFDMIAYGDRLEEWVDDLITWATGKIDEETSLNLKELKDAVGLIKGNAAEFAKWEQQWDHLVLQSGGWETSDVGVARLDYNDKLAMFDTVLLDLEMGGGIPNRTQFKHVVFGPQLWSGYDEAFFPAIRDLIEAKDWTEAKRFIAKTAAILRKAASTLVT